METTASFEQALFQAHDELAAEGKLSSRHKGIFRRLRKHREHAMSRAHREVRQHYIAEAGIMDTVKAIDWAAVVQWLKDHWINIVGIILSIVMFMA